MVKAPPLLLWVWVLGLGQAPPAKTTCVVILDAASGKTARSGASCDTPLSPASTYKIPHALIALETGVITTATVEKWDGTRHPEQPLWDRDHTVLSAMRPSVLWFFQRVAPRIGADRAHAWLQKFDYGNADTSGSIAEYWVNGRLRISPNQQLQFLRKFYAGELLVSAAHIAAVRSAIEQKPGTVQNARGVHEVAARWPSTASLNAKTGATTIASGESVSWLVGQLTSHGKKYVFASAVWRERGGVDGLDATLAAIQTFTQQGLLE